MFKMCASRLLLSLVFLPGVFTVAQIAPIPGNLGDDTRDFVELPAVAGYERQLATAIAAKLKTFSPRVDDQGNVVFTLGTGAPHPLIVTAIDEPGFVASGITPDGYVMVQRLPQMGSLPLFNELYSAQPVKIGTRQRSWINGSVAGVSIHLEPQRQHSPSAADLDNVYVDVGASSAEEARSAGVDLLNPIAIDRRFYQMGNGEWTAPAIGDRFGAAALIEVLRNLDRTKLTGSVTFAFVTQQWLGARGLQRVIHETNPDELIYIGRCMRAPAIPGESETTPSFQHRPGDGVLLAGEKSEGNATGFAAELTKLAADHQIKITTEYSASLLPRGGYMLQPKLPERTVHLAIATEWPSTPGEILQSQDVLSLTALIDFYLGSTPQIHTQPAPTLPEPPAPTPPHTAPAVERVLRELVETYGPSEHEENVRTAVTQLLPSWAKPITDDAGNLVVHLPSSSPHPAQRIVVVAHMDEIGYEVRSVLDDGRLELKEEGTGVLAYFLGHAALVHSSNGMHPGVLELPAGWDKSDFEWPRGRNQSFHMDVGAASPQQVAELGIKVGDFVTIPKTYRKLFGARASARALDDRVGCAALVEAAWALGGQPGAPKIPDRDVTLIWSTREELGLFGAAAAAKNMAANGKTPTVVFAIDTFVSADSPLESKRFADAPIGRGFVIRAVDNSNIVPEKSIDRVLTIARANNIAAQYGVTGGGNDGATFLLYGSTDVALGWALRYSHSPAEVIDVRDVDALGKIIAAVMRNW